MGGVADIFSVKSVELLAEAEVTGMTVSIPTLCVCSLCFFEVFLTTVA